MAFRSEMPTFAGGEISPEIEARFDTAKYRTAVRRARNVLVRTAGGLTSRAGTHWVGEVKESDEVCRLIPFTFSQDQSYAMLFGQAYMRPAALGGFVLEEELEITNISNANPAIVSATLHDYSAGDDLYIKGVAGMTEINGRTVRVVADLTANTFSIDLDTTGYGTFTGATGGITRTAPPDPPPAPPPVPPVIVDPEPPPATDGPAGSGPGQSPAYPGGHGLGPEPSTVQVP